MTGEQVYNKFVPVMFRYINGNVSCAFCVCAKVFRCSLGIRIYIDIYTVFLEHILYVFICDVSQCTCIHVQKQD